MCCTKFTSKIQIEKTTNKVSFSNFLKEHLKYSEEQTEAAWNILFYSGQFVLEEEDSDKAGNLVEKLAEYRIPFNVTIPSSHVSLLKNT